MNRRLGSALTATLIILALILVAGLSWYGASLHYKYQYDRATDTVSQGGNPSDEPASNTVPSGLRTYKNAQYGFELSYLPSVSLPYDSQHPFYYQEVKAGDNPIRFVATSENQLQEQFGLDNTIGYFKIGNARKPILQINVLQKPAGSGGAYDYVVKTVREMNSHIEPGARYSISAAKTSLAGKEAGVMIENSGSAGTPGNTSVFVENNGYFLVFIYNDYSSEAGPDAVNAYSEVGVLAVSSILDTLKLSPPDQQLAAEVLTDQMVKAALDGRAGSEKTLRPDIDKVARGDLNGDGYEDAFAVTGGCGACGHAHFVLINQKNGAAKLFEVNGINYISGATGSGGIEYAYIENNLLILRVFLDAESPVETWTYRFSNNTLLRVS